MTIEIIDILDSAVKIGLGAAIAAASTYAMANKKFNQELHKENLADFRKTLKEIAEAFEESNSGMDNFMSIIDLAINHGEEDLKLLERECKETLSICFKNTGKAYSLANLLGLHDLFKELRNYSDVIADVDQITNEFRDGLPDDGVEIEKLRIKGLQVCERIYPLLAAAYESKNA
jgi:hypothetical protein